MFATGSIAIVIAVYRIILVLMTVGSCSGLNVYLVAENTGEYCLELGQPSLLKLDILCFVTLGSNWYMELHVLQTKFLS